MSLEDKIVALAETIGTDVRELINGKMDKGLGGGLSDINFTQAEKTKLEGIATEATKNRDDSENADKLHTHEFSEVAGLDTALADKASKTELNAELALKADKVEGKVFSDTNFTQAEKDKLASLENYSDTNPFTDVEKTKLNDIAAEATKNRADSENADKEHTHELSDVNGLDTALESKASKTELTDGLALKVDKVVGKDLSDTNFTQEEKDKLAGLESSKFVGLFVSESVLPATGGEGEYANIDGGAGNDVYRVIWDSSDSKWVAMLGVSTALTDAQIKQQYESNPDTNAFTDVQKTKLAGIEAGATKNRADSANADKVHTHTTAQVTGLDTVLLNKVDKVAGKGLSSTDFTQAEKTKLAGLVTGATANRADTLNADKTHTHTTAQVTGLDAALLTKFDKTSVVQTTGTSTTNVMSQKAVTDVIANIPSVPKTAAYTVAAVDKGKSIDTTTNVTIRASVFTVGDVIVVTNTSATDSSILAASGVTIRLAGSTKTGTLTLAGYGVATLRMVTSNVWFASGAGLK